MQDYNRKQVFIELENKTGGWQDGIMSPTLFNICSARGREESQEDGLWQRKGEKVSVLAFADTSKPFACLISSN